MQALRSGKTLPTLCEAAELSDEALAMVPVAAEPRQFVELLIGAGHYNDAISFLAHALPRREAVWWAWLCARDAAGEKPKPAVAESLEATKAWIAEPTDAHRRAALEAAQEAGVATAAGCAGLAAFLCGDTLGPPTAPPAPPGEYAAAKAIGGSVTLAAVADPNADIPGRYSEFTRRGIELGDRIRLWTPEPGPTPPKR